MMPRGGQEFEFVVDGFSPDTMPVNRLAEYLQDVATLMGEYAHVHLRGIAPGSHRAILSVDDAAVPKVVERLRRVRIGEGDGKALAAANRINQRLAEDNTSGQLASSFSENVYLFPGVQRHNQTRVGPISDSETVIGFPIRLGGKGDVVPVHIEEPSGNVVTCHASREIAREIAHHIFTQSIRVHGIGKWSRDGHGDWVREDFVIHTFEVAPSLDLVDDIEAMKPAFHEIASVEDPLKLLNQIRHG